MEPRPQSEGGKVSWRLTPSEVSGGLADLAVLVPLEVSLIAINGLNPTSTLLGVGITYIVAARYFRIPMPVQPLKVFAVVAVAEALAPSTIAAGAILMAAVMGFLAVTGLINVLARAVPVAVVRGVQAGLGLLLLKGAVNMFWSKPFFVGGERRTMEVAGASVPLGLAVGVLGIALLLLALRWRRVPATGLLLAVGAALGFFIGAGTRDFQSVSLGPAAISFAFPSLDDFSRALPLLVVPQLSVTLTNSVLATVDAAATYFGAQAARVTPRRVSLSISLANVWAGLFGGLPACHGCGGLTAHYRLGARSPVATVFVGVLLVAVALLFGNMALPVRTLIPYAIFGVLLLYVGWHHFLLGLNVPHRAQLALVALVAAVSLLPGSNLAYGLGAGLVTWWGLRLATPHLPAPVGRRVSHAMYGPSVVVVKE